MHVLYWSCCDWLLEFVYALLLGLTIFANPSLSFSWTTCCFAETLCSHVVYVGGQYESETSTK